MNFKKFDFVDMTHRLTSDIPTWNGTCGFSHKIELDYVDCTGEAQFRVQKLEMKAGIGTHMDAPSHCFENGIHIADIPISRLIAPCAVIDVSRDCHSEYVIQPSEILSFEDKYGTLQEGEIVLFYTGWEHFWDDPVKYRNNLKFPGLSEAGAILLKDRKVSGVGIDTLSIDHPPNGYPAHRILLGEGVFLIENVMSVLSMPPRGGFLFCFPMKGAYLTEAPVRLIGMRNRNT